MDIEGVDSEILEGADLGMTEMLEHRSAPQSYALPRAERLRGRGAVAALFSEGESGFVFPIKYLVRRRDEGCELPTSVLFTVPKRYHKRANKRNLLRRRIKESYRLKKSLLGDVTKGLDIAFIYTTKELLDSRRIAHSIEKILSQIADLNIKHPTN